MPFYPPDFEMFRNLGLGDFFPLPWKISKKGLGFYDFMHVKSVVKAKRVHEIGASFRFTNKNNPKKNKSLL